jgi:hypothetical protein
MKRLSLNVLVILIRIMCAQAERESLCKHTVAPAAINCVCVANLQTRLADCAFNILMTKKYEEIK